MKWIGFAVLALLAVLVMFCIVCRLVYGPSGADRSRHFNRLNGRYRVLYDDGQYSEPMCHDVASDYAEIFGGTVVPKSAYQKPETAKKGGA
jgi:hypothetical protein